ncbi:hypothetical protein J4E83_007998 [Alternaria metachromatica]|uniref:uncharacterized protein n=1 Tax=Alternaria metachromatica TaxID=283354 RepID=UPI0020C3E143|nr:uncharacterized protein J4E83_007998 [Alternaria metachromatica]KAI4611747.1 hypothetical protein J4E83_007998 [Alternaria metachromatica]
MGNSAPNMQLPDAATILQSVNATIDHTASLFPTSGYQVFQSVLRTLLILLFLFVTYHCFHYFTCELPPFGSGLKALPGPRSTLPYLGRVHDVDRMQAWTSMHKFSKQYGGLFACTLGGETHIWVAREDVAQDLMVKNAELSSARADIGSFPGVTQDFLYLPLLGYTDHFHRQKRFANAMMTRAAKNQYYGHIQLEMKRFMQELSRKPEDFFTLTHLFCARISSRLAYGTADRSIEHMINAGAFISQLGPSGPIPNLMPFLRYFPEWMAPGQRGVRERREKEAALWKDAFDLAKASKDKAIYTTASLATKAIGSDTDLLFADEEEAKAAVGMLCTVAIYTIGGPATLFVMAMILHPEWQTKVRQQIDEVVGKDEMVDFKHSPRLPILRAAIKECVRWKSTVPLGVPRLLSKNYTHSGYHFPRGAVVHVLDIAMSQNPTTYSSSPPSVYDPSRWLDPSSPNFKSPLTEYPRLKGHHIFGRGKRVCPGQDLAEAELLVFCGNLVKNFELGKKDGIEIGPDQWTPHVIGGPLPFPCEIKVRDDQKARVVGE